MILDTAVIPCGGLGTRLRPITRWLPKEMLPVALRPLLHWVLDEAADAGLLRAVIITNPNKPMLEAVARSYPGPLVLEFVPQDHPRGLGDALLRAADNLAGSPFAAILPDNLFHGPNPTADVLAVHRATGRPTVLLAEPPAPENRSARGRVARAEVREDPEGWLRVTAIGEKEEPSGLAPIGRMAFPGDTLKAFEAVGRELPPGVEFDDVPVLRRLAAAGLLAGVRTRARFMDVGVPAGYREAVAAFPAGS